MRAASAVLFAVTLAAGAVAGADQVETVNVPAFGQVTVYVPQGSPQNVVLFLSGDGGWNLGVVGMAERLRREGALVVGIDVRAFMRTLDSSTRCAYPAGALEELSRAVQVRFRVPRYQRPILVGYSSGATLAYGAIAAAPPETFSGAISLGFCPDIEMHAPLCPMRGLKSTRRVNAPGFDLAPFKQSTVPWIVLQGEADQVCDPKMTEAFVAATGSARMISLPRVGHGFGVPANWETEFVRAYHTIADAQRATAPPLLSAPAVADLPLVEVPRTSGDDRDLFAIVLSGDGGWADIDKSIAAGLAARGVPVVGWNSLDYYWTARTPAAAATDLQRIIDYYSDRWSRTRVLIIGYSFGADVAPFLINRLPVALQARITRVGLLGPSSAAAFAFHVTSWLGFDNDRQYPTASEIDRLAVPVTCVMGIDESDSVCRDLKSSHVRAVLVGTGHHFGGEYNRIVDVLLQGDISATAANLSVHGRT